LLLRAALKLRSLCQDAEKKLQELSEKEVQALAEKEMLELLENDLHEQAETELREFHIQIVSDEQESASKDLRSDSEVEYEYLESYDVTLECSEDADEMVSIEPANSAPEESVYSLSPKPEAGEEDDSGQDPSFACTRCHKVFSELVKLNTHMKVHLTEKPHECE